jgi:hypothetical protein
MLLQAGAWSLTQVAAATCAADPPDKNGVLA